MTEPPPGSMVNPTGMAPSPGSLPLRVACQTYTWQMLGDRWLGQLQPVLDAIAGAGYQGVEITWQMLGDWLDRPDAARREFEARGLKLAALALSPPSGWTDQARYREDDALLSRAFGFLAAFPAPRLGLGGGRLPGDTRYPEHIVPPPATADPYRSAAFERMLGRYRHTAGLAASRGVVVHVHPTSTTDSLIRVRADYDRLVDGLADLLSSGALQLGPDTAHIVRGDEAPAAFVRRNVHQIGHIHLKDARARGGPFAPLGTGDADIPAVLVALRTSGYAGWIVAEEESESAASDPAAAIGVARSYLRSLGV